jgi:hypothetical protein
MVIIVRGAFTMHKTTDSPTQHSNMRKRTKWRLLAWLLILVALPSCGAAIWLSSGYITLPAISLYSGRFFSSWEDILARTRNPVAREHATAVLLTIASTQSDPSRLRAHAALLANPYPEEALTILTKVIERDDLDEVSVAEAAEVLVATADHWFPTHLGTVFAQEGLRSLNLRIRVLTIESLGHAVFTRPDFVVSKLVELCYDDSPTIRKWSLSQLSKCGPRAKSALPALEKLLVDEKEPDVRSYIREAVRNVGQTSEDVEQLAARIGRAIKGPLRYHDVTPNNGLQPVEVSPARRIKLLRLDTAPDFQNPLGF